MRTTLKCLAVLAALALLPAPSHAGDVHTDVPAQIKADARYLIYVHGGWPESRRPTEPHPRRGFYEYDKIVAALAAGGFEVISELRREKTNPRRYARTRVVPQVEALTAAGVPLGNITVAGFSKGGSIALLVATQIRNPAFNFVVMAGCGAGQVRKSYDSFLANDASKMQGRMLSIYDGKDTIAGTCAEAAAKGQSVTFEETVLELGTGHGAFYSANPAWTEKIASWAMAAPAPTN